MKAGEAARALVEASGLGAIVRLALEAQSALVDRLAAAAKEHGVSAASIAKARAAKRKYDRAMSLVALLYPIMGRANDRIAEEGRRTRASNQRTIAARKKEHGRFKW